MRIETDDDVLILRLQAGKANAVNEDFLEGLGGLLDELAPRGERAVVLTGYDRFFSAGFDLVYLSGQDREGMRRFLGLFHDTFLRLFSLARPVVAAVNGHAIAGGCVLAMQADHRILADGPFKIGLNETSLGVGLPALVMETFRAQLSSRDLAEVALEGRLYSPTDALARGLGHELAPAAELIDRALTRARELGAIPPAAFAQAKEKLRRPAVRALAMDADLDREAWLDTWFSEDAIRIREEAIRRLQS